MSLRTKADCVYLTITGCMCEFICSEQFCAIDCSCNVMFLEVKQNSLLFKIKKKGKYADACQKVYCYSCPSAHVSALLAKKG